MNSKARLPKILCGSELLCDAKSFSNSYSHHAEERHMLGIQEHATQYVTLDVCKLIG
jgi:hypothetical protein